jgi:hypothetical protein
MEIPGREPYVSATRELLRESGCTVLKWRTNNTGIAWTRSPDWWIEAPEPRGPASYVVVAHEVAHQMLHRDRSGLPRWRQEVEAWEWALATFDRFGLPGEDVARASGEKSVRYAYRKALLRGADPAAMVVEARDELGGWAADLLVNEIAEVAHRLGSWYERVGDARQARVR